MSSADSAGAEFLAVARKELREGAAKVRTCLGRLSIEQIWHRDHAVENSIGNLVLHVAGNMRQWIVCGVGGEEDRRDRDWEFSTRERLPAKDLLDRLDETVSAADAVLRALPAERLLEMRRIQVYDVSVLHAILHVATHFAGHVGQIIWATKHVTAQDLGFYGYLKQPAAGAQGRSP